MILVVNKTFNQLIPLQMLTMKVKIKFTLLSTMPR